MTEGCGGDALLVALEEGVERLAAHEDEVNGLNVFPVPDGDTGSNMLATLRAALADARAVPGPDRPAGSVAEAMGFGALMGARGNSGVILSQILRGMASALAGKRRFNGLDLAFALASGRDAAYAAVVRPVEGTILTVIDDAAAAAVEHAERDPGIEGVVAAAVTAAERAVARTPALLPVLRQAGVVDAGGQGLLRIFEGALAHLAADGRGEGTGSARSVVTGSPRRAPAGAVAPAEGLPFAPGGDEGFGYETMFVVSAGDRPLDLAAVRGRLEELGESVLVAGDERVAKVHVHNERPDEILAYGLSLGTLTHISVMNMDEQTREVEAARAGRAEERAGADAQGLAGGAAAAAATAGPCDTGGTAVVAVAAGDGLVRALESVGVDAVVQGGQGANPSTGELLDAIRRVPAREVLVLPNNPNVKLAAEQAATLCGEKRVVVVPTRNVPEGIAALLARDADRSADENAVAMRAAARDVQTLLVTEAVRDARFGDRKVKRGQVIVLDPDDGLVAAGKDPIATALDALGRLEPGFELVTIYYGEGADLREAETLGQRIVEEHETVETEIVHGGQPHYRYLIAAE